MRGFLSVRSSNLMFMSWHYASYFSSSVPRGGTSNEAELGTPGVKTDSIPSLSRQSDCPLASRFTNGAGSRDQESIVEAVNGYLL